MISSRWAVVELMNLIKSLLLDESLIMFRV